jgi:hypothetical protein
MGRDNASGGHGPPRAARILEALFAQLGGARPRDPPQRFVVWATAQGVAGQAAMTYSVDFRDGEGRRFSALYLEQKATERSQPPDMLGYDVGIS